MATTNDIDSDSSVRKFLERSVVSDQEDKTADSSDEVTSVLQSIALSFLLYPQTALSFVLNSKNILQQSLTLDIEIINFLLKTIDEVNNPDEPVTDISELIEAQSALVEVDRVGRVSSDVVGYVRYNQAITKFLDKKLGKALRRRKQGEFERTGNEAKQDIFQILSIFKSNHSSVISNLNLLYNSVADFNSVDLTKIVAASVLSKVRDSLKKVINGITTQLSKTAVAIELMSGAASLQSISDSRAVYDPTISTDIIPTNRTIKVRSQTCSAIAIGTDTDTDLSSVSTPWTFSITVDPEIGSGTSFSIVYPHSGASQRAFVKASIGSPTYNIPVDKKTIYVQFDGIAPPANQAVMIRTVVLPTGGAVTLSAILTTLNDGSTGLIDGTAVEIANTGRILIYGSASVTKITVLSSVPGSFDVGGNYVYSDTSAHNILGFSFGQTSPDINLIKIDDIVDILSAYISIATFSKDGSGHLKISSNSSALLSSLSFSSSVASSFGFEIGSIYESSPEYLELVEGDSSVDPNSVGVFIGSVVSAPDTLSVTRSLFSAITSIDETKLIFDPSVTLPRTLDSSVVITSPSVFQAQKLINVTKPYISTFDQDFIQLQQVLTPILSSPSVAQINDSKAVLNSIKAKIQNLLNIIQSVIVTSEQSEFKSIADQIILALQERNLDRAIAFLYSCQFSEFFNLDNSNSSKSSRFLSATADVGRNDLSTTTVEPNQADLVPKGITPDKRILTGNELMEDEEQL